jgi:hypothetical protein
MQKEGKEPLLIKCGFILNLAFLIFNFAFLHSGATAQDLHPLPYSPRSLHGAPGRFFLKRTKETEKQSLPFCLRRGRYHARVGKVKSYQTKRLFPAISTRRSES